MKHSEQTLQEENKNYLKLLGLSIAAEYIANKTIVKIIPGGLVSKELVENFISKKIAKQGNFELTKQDQAIGALPIFGFNAASVHCARKLLMNILETEQTSHAEVVKNNLHQAIEA